MCHEIAVYSITKDFKYTVFFLSAFLFPTKISVDTHLRAVLCILLFVFLIILPML